MKIHENITWHIWLFSVVLFWIFWMNLMIVQISALHLVAIASSLRSIIYCCPEWQHKI